MFAAANPEGARRLILAIPNAFEAGQIVLRARAANPGINVIARAHSDAEVEHLKGLGADTVIMGEREIARGIVEEVLGHKAGGALNRRGCSRCKRVDQATKAEPPFCATLLRYFAGGLPSAFLNMVMKAVTDS